MEGASVKRSPPVAISRFLFSALLVLGKCDCESKFGVNAKLASVLEGWVRWIGAICGQSAILLQTKWGGFKGAGKVLFQSGQHEKPRKGELAAAAQRKREQRRWVADDVWSDSVVEVSKGRARWTLQRLRCWSRVAYPDVGAVRRGSLVMCARNPACHRSHLDPCSFVRSARWSVRARGSSCRDIVLSCNCAGGYAGLRGVRAADDCCLIWVLLAHLLRSFCFSDLQCRQSCFAPSPLM